MGKKYLKKFEFEKASIIVPDVVKVTADYKSDDYLSIIQSLGFSNIQTRAIIKGIKRIFNNKKSESREGFYSVNLNNVKQHFYNGDGNSLSVNRPRKLDIFILNNPNADLISIHNHRADTIPSPSDLYMISQFKNSNKGLIVGNKGSIYYYEAKHLINAAVFLEYKTIDDLCETMEKRKREMLRFCKNNDIILIEIKKGGIKDE